MADAFDGPLDRLTEPLRVDPELCLEVRKELRTHLEQAAADFAADDRPIEEAGTLALKALGDEAELTRQLWSANRPPDSLAHVVALRAAMIALVPLAITLTLSPFAGRLRTALNETPPSRSGNPYAFDIHAVVNNWLYGVDMPATPLISVADVMYFLTRDGDRRIDHLSADEQFLFHGLPTDKKPTDVVHTLAQRFPNDPAYVALDLIARLEGDAALQSDDLKVRQAVPLSPWLADIERGRKMEPENALYDYLEAALLLRVSTDFDYRKHGPMVASVDWNYRSPTIEMGQTELSDLQIADPQVFSQALSALQRGAAKPHFNHHGADLWRRREALLPAPRTVAELVGTAAIWDGVTPPWSDCLLITRRVSTYAVLQAARAMSFQPKK